MSVGVPDRDRQIPHGSRWGFCRATGLAQRRPHRVGCLRNQASQGRPAANPLSVEVIRQWFDEEIRWGGCCHGQTAAVGQTVRQAGRGQGRAPRRGRPCWPFTHCHGTVAGLECPPGYDISPWVSPGRRSDPPAGCGINGGAGRRRYCAGGGCSPAPGSRGGGPQGLVMPASFGRRRLGESRREMVDTFASWRATWIRYAATVAGSAGRCCIPGRGTSPGSRLGPTGIDRLKARVSAFGAEGLWFVWPGGGTLTCVVGDVRRLAEMGGTRL